MRTEGASKPTPRTADTGGKPSAAPAPQSAAAPSPFPPIADYAFLSNCHTGALVAPDGSIDWLCVPRFDSPSVFGTLLDRQAGMFRLGPFGINVPTARVYEPGTNVLATTWNTPTGWVLVRDALTMGASHGEDRITPHTRPPADDDGDHMLVRLVVCLEGTPRSSWSASRTSTTGGSRPSGRWSAKTATPPTDAARTSRSG
jgi:GH15 family glucan-1,4-alpha-glucosidase